MIYRAFSLAYLNSFLQSMGWLIRGCIYVKGAYHNSDLKVDLTDIHRRLMSARLSDVEVRAFLYDSVGFVIRSTSPN